MTKKPPLVSFVVSLHNASRKNLKICIDSIINQTFQDIEIILIDDKNDQDVDEYLDYLDNKINNLILVKNYKNIGLTKSLIKGISIASGIFIARQDVDDISDSTRIEKQVKFLKENANIVMLGTGIQNIDFVLRTNKKMLNSSKHDELVQQMFRTNPFCHSSVVFRKDAYVDTGGYNPKYYTTQDLDLWFRMADYGKIAILNEELVTRQLFSDSISKKFSIAILQVYNGAKIRIRERKKFLENLVIIKIIYATLRMFAATIIYDRLKRILKYIT